jgi:hypothetical protein
MNNTLNQNLSTVWGDVWNSVWKHYHENITNCIDISDRDLVRMTISVNVAVSPPQHIRHFCFEFHEKLITYGPNPKIKNEQG